MNQNSKWLNIKPKCYGNSLLIARTVCEPSGAPRDLHVDLYAHIIQA